MAVQPDVTAEEVIALYRPATYFVGEACSVSALAFVVYDWLVTLSREIDLFWTGKTRLLPAMLYFTNKYLNLLSSIVSTFQMAPLSNKSCTQTAFVIRLLLYLSLIPPAGFTALRAYALTRSWWLCALVFLLLIAQFVVNMIPLIWIRVFGFHSSVWGCVTGILFLPSSPRGQLFLVVNRVPAIVADLILVVVTWRLLPASVIRIYNVSTESWKFQGLACVMLRNGIMYFFVLSMLNVLQLVLTLGYPAVPDGLFSYVWYFTFPLSSILVSHFLLELQEAYQRSAAGLATEDLSGASQGGRSSINFALGSVGATTSPVADHIEEEYDQAALDDHLLETEGVPQRESDLVDQSRVEDVSEIMEVPRGGGSGETVRA